MKNKGPLIWEAHEFIFQEKTSDWYWIVGILGVTAGVLAYIFGNTLFFLLALLITFSILIAGSKRPNLVRFELNKKGIVIGNILYPYISLESFWVDDFDEVGIQSKLLIKSKKMVMPIIVIPIEGVSAEEVRDYLMDNMYEERHDEPLSHRIFEYFGF